MKAAVEVAEIGVARMRNELKAGMTEDELWSILHKTNIEHGGEWIECRILSSGERTNPWMQESSNKIIQKVVKLFLLILIWLAHMDIALIFQELLLKEINLTLIKKIISYGCRSINHNYRLIKPGMSFIEFTEKSWILPDEFYGNRYSCYVTE